MPIIRRGFFDSNEQEEMGVGKNLIEDSCGKCGLYKGCLSPKMPVTGEGKKKILVIAEAPGEQEDQVNKQLVGDAGNLLRKRLSERGIDLNRDCWKTNSVICRPKDNRTPTKSELKACKPNIDKSIRELKPDFIWLFGKSAVESFYMGKFSKLEISRWRNLCIPDRATGAYILPMYHPSYVLRNETDEIINSVFDRDLDFTIKCLSKKKFRHKNPLDYVHPLTKADEVIEMLEIILDEKPEYLTFDYETTGLKPYNKGHKIACISACDNDEYAFSFPYQHDLHKWEMKDFEQITKLWRSILLSKIQKIMQNSKFEQIWSRKFFCDPKNIIWCSMNEAHIIDAREKFTGLKFQSYIHFGVEDYSKNISKYLEDSDIRGFNKVMQAPFTELLTYSATDSLMTKWLFNIQKDFFDKHPSMEKARVFNLNGLNCLADMQEVGINADIKYYSKQFLDLGEEIKRREVELNNFTEISQFQNMFHKKLDYESPTDLRNLFFKVMGIASIKETKGGSQAVDVEVLRGIKHPLAKKILEKRKLDKTRGTYIAQFLREINDDNRIHPFFNLHIPTTYRSSSSMPNWQNIPIRDEEAKKVTRLGIILTKGFKILDFDYAAMEVRAAAMYAKDPVLIAYIKDPKTDMHRDTCADLFGLDPKQVTKKLRFNTKNGFVFPEFYGSYYKNTAKNLWAESIKLALDDGTPVKDHLENVGIIKNGNYFDFENHVKWVEKEYWKKFKVFKQWQEQVLKNFIKTGYVEMFHGFRVGGYLTRNDIINYRIQGTAFHCLLWSIIEINKALKGGKFASRLIGQIHDNGILEGPSEEEKEVIALCTDIATVKIREAYEWINVPLAVEWETTEVDESWYYKKEKVF
jgi:uracil-DNA glycosylase family 4